MTRQALLATVVGAIGLPLTQAGIDTGTLALARLSICGATITAAAVYDLCERRIPNRLTLPAAAGCLALIIAGGAHIADLAAGLTLIALLTVVSLVVPEAFGMGDIKLMLVVVAGLDGRAIPALALGLFTAAAFGVTLIVRHGRPARTRTLPLAPFIAAGTLLALLT